MDIEEERIHDDYDDQVYEQLVDNYISAHNGVWKGNGPLLQNLKECMGIIKDNG